MGAVAAWLVPDFSVRRPHAEAPRAVTARYKRRPAWGRILSA